MSTIKEIVLPQELGEGTESLVVMWHKEVGDAFEEGETLVEVQTEKTIYEVPAPFSGILKEIKVVRGNTAKPGEIIAIASVNNGELK